MLNSSLEGLHCCGTRVWQHTEHLSASPEKVSEKTCYTDGKYVVTDNKIHALSGTFKMRLPVATGYSSRSPHHLVTTLFSQNVRNL